MLYKTDFVVDLENTAMRQKFPTIKLVGRWWDKIVEDTESGKPLEAERYGPLKRVRRRYTEYVNEQYLPTVTVKDLTLEPLFR
jgi:hypothetical protein